MQHFWLTYRAVSHENKCKVCVMFYTPHTVYLNAVILLYLSFNTNLNTVCPQGCAHFSLWYWISTFFKYRNNNNCVITILSIRPLCLRSNCYLEYKTVPRSTQFSIDQASKLWLLHWSIERLMPLPKMYNIYFQEGSTPNLCSRTKTCWKHCRSRYNSKRPHD